MDGEVKLNSSSWTSPSNFRKTSICIPADTMNEYLISSDGTFSLRNVQVLHYCGRKTLLSVSQCCLPTTKNISNSCFNSGERVSPKYMPKIIWHKFKRITQTSKIETTLIESRRRGNTKTLKRHYLHMNSDDEPLQTENNGVFLELQHRGTFTATYAWRTSLLQ